MRKLKKSDLVGKTIIDVDAGSSNYLLLSFDDETELEIWCEHLGMGVLGFLIDGEEDDTDEEDCE